MYLTVFRNRKRADIDAAAYAEDAARMEALAAAQPGFVSYRFYQSDDGESVSLSEWASADHARAWARHADHLAVQGKGRADYYASYTVYSCDQPGVRQFNHKDPA